MVSQHITFLFPATWLVKSRSVIGWEERELWEGERNVWTLWQPWQAPVDGLSVCVDIFVREQREEVGTTVPIQSVRKEKSEHTLSHTTQHNKMLSRINYDNWILQTKD